MAKLVLFLAGAALVASYDLPELYRGRMYKEFWTVVAILLLTLPLVGKKLWDWPVPNPKLFAELVGWPVQALLEAWLTLSKPS